MPSSARTLATAPSSMSVLRVRRFSSSLARRQSGRMEEKIWVCFTWPAITARVTPSALEGVDESRELAQRHPVDADVRIGGGACVHLRISLLLDRGDHDGEAFSPRSIEQQEGKTSVASDQPEFVGSVRHKGYLMMPRWLLAMKSAR